MPNTGPGLEAVVEQLGEDPPVAGIPGGVERGDADGTVVGLVDDALLG